MPLRLLIVDDSALTRNVLRELFESDPEVQVVGAARSGQEALRMVAELRPDVVTMDVQMPGMDGIETTERLMAYHPTPILVLTSTLSRQEVDITFKMLEVGALEVVEKPTLSDQVALTRARTELTRKVKLLARVKVVTHLRGRRRLEQQGSSRVATAAPPPRTTPAVAMPTLPPPTVNASPSLAGFPVVVIGASTGGPKVIRQLLAGLPTNFGAAVVVVQHISRGFSQGMVEWLGEVSGPKVVLAQEGMPVVAGRVLVAPDSAELLFSRLGTVHLTGQQLLIQHPAVDITMQAAAEVFGARTLGVLLTGMGRDGAAGMQSIRRAGGHTIAQDQASCSIYGMPKAAVDLGAVHEILAPDEIIQTLIRRVAGS
ncbi:MAG: chemotaxis-specific protein-glutamate methyltransferase CheB [Chloroflexaceae bacterium]|jgi:two-component system chemotaxis response regulator CheB|nr:chemotaxis-specific protein-glutamate methyltransferase CheB [Chloroflexaceae bacterium]